MSLLTALIGYAPDQANTGQTGTDPIPSSQPQASQPDPSQPEQLRPGSSQTESAEYESDLKSERLKLKHAELAAEGKWEGGMRNFGYDLGPYPDLESGRVKYRLVLNPKESAALAAAAKEVIGGRSHTAVAIAWNKHRLTTTQGKPFTPQKVKELLLSPKTAGLRYVDGKPVTSWLGWLLPRLGDERGDVPGWVLITAMTVALVMLIWGVARDALRDIITGFLNQVRFD